MDKHESYVCRHKRHLIAERLAGEKAALREFAVKIFAEEKNTIRETKLEDIKPLKFLEILVNAQSRKSVEDFWSFLRQTLPDLYDELTVEISAERNELMADARTRSEVRHHVQRTFGGSRCLSEREKNKLEQLLCTRIQVANEVWRRKLDRVSSELRKSEVMMKECDETVGSLVLDLDERVEMQKRRMLKFLPEEKQRRVRSVIMKHNREYPSRRQVAWKKLESSLAKEEVLFDYCLTCSEEMTRERMKVLKMLNLERDQLTTELDEEVKEMMSHFCEDIEILKETIGEHRKKLKIREEEMVQMMREYTRQIDEKDYEVQHLKSVMKQVQQISIKLESDLRNSRKELLETKNELSRCKTKCQSLEVSHHISIPSETAESADKDVQEPNLTSRNKCVWNVRSTKSRSSTLPKLTRLSESEKTSRMKRRLKL